MATSAFRSTTRRGCQGGYTSSADANGVPSTPRSKRDPSPSGRGHRRSTSMTDFSARYLSDCSSTSDFRSSARRSSAVHGGRRSVCPSDSESDMEVLSMRRPRRRWGAESEDERPLRSSFSVTKASDSQPKGLRRTSSSQDVSQYTSNLENEVVVFENKSGKDDTEDLVEEKTIGAVFDQMKPSLRLEPPVADVGMTDLLDSMRSEVRRAVADIRIELEESLQRNETGSSTSDHRRGSEGTIVIRSVADIQKEYSTKLEESEKRVQELRSQIAVEERRCLELSKIVKELLPTPPPLNLEISTPQATSSGRRRKNSSERQIVVESLDVEAQKYFEECVSISSFDCHADSDDSVLEKENISAVRKSRPADGETNAKMTLVESGVKGDAQSKDLVVGSDGVVLPWLKWEAEAGGAVDKNPKQGTKKHTSPRSSSSSSTGGRGGFSRVAGSSDQFYRSGSAKSNATRRPGSSESLSDQLGAFPTMPLFSIDDQVAQADHHLDVDSALFDKIQFQCRVNSGELLLCQGLFLM